MLEGRENSEKQRLMLIDFEYSSYNYRYETATGGSRQPCHGTLGASTLRPSGLRRRRKQPGPVLHG